MHTSQSDAMRSLSGPGIPIAAAADHVPAHPGLYAVHAAPAIWQLLGLAHRGPEVPLYVGKAEDSLVSRELKTHFALGQTETSTTGSSTLRRSFAALLREHLDLRGVPRNKLKPGYFAMFALEPDADERLSTWMRSQLTLAVWPNPAAATIVLEDLEKKVLAAWEPPLNLKDVPRPSKRLKAARKVMAGEARVWALANGFAEQHA